MKYSRKQAKLAVYWQICNTAILANFLKHKEISVVLSSFYVQGVIFVTKIPFRWR